MTEHGWDADDWPEIFEQVMAADILVLLTPIWLGEKSSVCTRVIERLYGNSGAAQRGRPVRLLRPGRRLPDHRQRGRHQALLDEHPLLAPAPRLHDPAQADAGWIGEAGPGPSYLDDPGGGPTTTSPTATPRS